MSAVDHRIRIFRDKYERDLRRIVTQGCAVAGCTNDGNPQVEESVMNELARLVLEIVDKSKRERKRSTAELTVLQKDRA